MDNRDVLEAVEVISKYCESTILADGCNNCIINGICLNALGDKTGAIPLYWIKYIGKN